MLKKKKIARLFCVKLETWKFDANVDKRWNWLEKKNMTNIWFLKRGKFQGNVINIISACFSLFAPARPPELWIYCHFHKEWILFSFSSSTGIFPDKFYFTNLRVQTKIIAWASFLIFIFFCYHQNNWTIYPQYFNVHY